MQPIKKFSGDSPFRPQPKPVTPKKEKKPLSKNRKATGELDVFKQIWQRRPHRSQFSLTPIRDFDPGCFDHILPKSTHKKSRLDPLFIKILTREEHRIRTEVARSDWPKEFREWFEFHENELKELYKKKYPK